MQCELGVWIATGVGNRGGGRQQGQGPVGRRTSTCGTSCVRGTPRDRRFLVQPSLQGVLKSTEIAHHQFYSVGEQLKPLPPSTRSGRTEGRIREPRAESREAGSEGVFREAACAVAEQDTPERRETQQFAGRRARCPEDPRREGDRIPASAGMTVGFAGSRLSALASRYTAPS